MRCRRPSGPRLLECWIRTDVANPPRRLLAIAAAPDGAAVQRATVCRLSKILSQIHRRYTFGRDGDLRATERPHAAKFCGLTGRRHTRIPKHSPTVVQLTSTISSR